MLGTKPAAQDLLPTPPPTPRPHPIPHPVTPLSPAPVPIQNQLPSPPPPHPRLAPRPRLATLPPPPPPPCPCAPPQVPRPVDSLVTSAPMPPPPPPPRQLVGGQAGEPVVTKDDDNQGIVTGSSSSPSRPSPSNPQLSVTQPDLFSEVAQLQPTPPNTATATDRAKLNQRAFPHEQPVAPICPQPPPISESARPRDEQREVTVRSAKPTSTGNPVTKGAALQARWTAEELQSAIHAADEAAHLLNGSSADRDSLDANARDALLASWAGGMTRSEFASYQRPGQLLNVPGCFVRKCYTGAHRSFGSLGA